MVLKSRLNRFQVALLLLPGLLVFGMFTVYPIFRLLWMSLCDWSFASMLNQPFAGLQNYRDVLGDSVFWTVFLNSVVYTLITVPGQMILGLFTAVLINGVKRFSVTFRVINYLPVITSWVIASLVFRYIFNTEGLLNYFLTQVLHLTQANVRWLNSRWSGLTVAMVLGIWKGVGWNMVVFLAALQQVPNDLYEAAEIDGCGAWKKFVSVTLPSIRGTILFALIMLTIGGFNVFTSIKMITGGKPAHQTDTLLTWMYYKAFSTGKFGYAAALSFIMALSLGLLAILQFKAMQNKDA
ncbi:MAG: sugar ABC transporter permease [Clostridiales bacterium]|nr:sugar ABC transporter permease [Clostridiales bacterium]MDO4350812.1 sugar ABC transporter permease [Eubacteriales bacterium]MDY4008411.1 sugar ABC transporter permease [Candidatus Limiplasma sp.]